MQAHTPRGIGACSVFLVARYRGFHPFHVGADLVLFAGAQREFDEGVVPSFAEDGVVRDGFLAGGVEACPHFAVAVFAEKGGDGPVRFRQTPFDNRGITPVQHHLFPVLLEYLLCLLIFGVDNQAGGFPVEVHYEEPGRRIAPFDVFAQNVKSRSAVLLFRPHREQPVAFVGHDQAGIFVDDAEHRMAQRSGGLYLVYRHGIACLQGRVVPGGVATVHSDLTVCQAGFYGAAASAGHAFQEEGQQRAVRFYFVFHLSLFECSVRLFQGNRCVAFAGLFCLDPFDDDVVHGKEGFVVGSDSDLFQNASVSVGFPSGSSVFRSSAIST